MLEQFAKITAAENRKSRGLGYGTFDVSTIKEILFIEDTQSFHEARMANLPSEIKQQIVEFCERNPNWVIGEAYQCYGLYLLSEKPPKFKGKETGYYGRGANTLLENCPSKLLLLAEDD